ncbi:MAG: hypothetical protein V1660_01060 [archaeon]
MTEKNEGINIDDPLVMIFRMMMLEKEAKNERSDLYCPKCNTNLPKRPPFLDFSGTDCYIIAQENRNYYCGLCDEYF